MASTVAPIALSGDDSAAPPYRPARRSFRHALRQYRTVLRILLAEYRSSWFFHMFFGLLLPISFVFFLKTAGGDLSQDRAIFLLGGNMAVSIAFGPTSLLLIKMGWWQQTREFHFWAGLPLAKLTLVLGLVTVALLLALPGLLGVYVLGSLLLGLRLTATPLLLPLVLLSSLSLVGFGALIGSYVRNGQTANIVANMLIMLIGFLSPTMIPLEALPWLLRLTALLIPTTYAADAFRAVLSGRLDAGLALDVLVLSVIAVVFLTLVHRKVDWRSV